MMSITNVKTRAIIYQQTLYKIKGFSGMIWTLMVLQILAIASTFGGVGGGGMSESGPLDLHYTIFNATFVIIFTFLWILVSAFLITTRSYETNDYSFITTRFTSHAANAGFLFAVSILAGFTAMLSSYIIQFAHWLAFDTELAVGAHLTIGEFLLGWFGMILYLLLLGSAGYFLGWIFQVSPLLRIAVFVIAASVLFGIPAAGNALESVFYFFTQERNILLFAVKVGLTTVAFWGITYALTRNLEVRR